MRGQQKLFNDFIIKPHKKPENTGIQRPRNFYMPERNELVVHRYYFWSVIKKQNYLQCLRELEADVHICATTLGHVLDKSYDLLTVVMNEKPSIKDLQKKFPRMNWNL